MHNKRTTALLVVHFYIFFRTPSCLRPFRAFLLQQHDNSWVIYFRLTFCVRTPTHPWIKGSLHECVGVNFRGQWRFWASHHSSYANDLLLPYNSKIALHEFICIKRIIMSYDMNLSWFHVMLNLSWCIWFWFEQEATSPDKFECIRVVYHGTIWIL